MQDPLQTPPAEPGDWSLLPYECTFRPSGRVASNLCSLPCSLASAPPCAARSPTRGPSLSWRTPPSHDPRARAPRPSSAPRPATQPPARATGAARCAAPAASRAPCAGRPALSFTAVAVAARAPFLPAPSHARRRSGSGRRPRRAIRTPMRRSPPGGPACARSTRASPCARAHAELRAARPAHAGRHPQNDERTAFAKAVRLH
jgi:hypothetical protein